MRISVFSDDSPSATKYVEEVLDVTFDEIGEVICKRSWSPFCFSRTIENGKKVRHRSSKSFKLTDLLVLDVDEGRSIDQAKRDFAGFQFTIATTKSHRKPKGDNGIVCDRFRVLIPLERRVTSKEEYAAVWMEAKKRWPYIDPSCKDTARFYYKSRKVVSSIEGKKFAIPNISGKANHDSTFQRDDSFKGQLYASTWEFIARGAPNGDWHRRMYSAAMDLKAKGYSKSEATEQLRKATRDFKGDLDEHDVHLIRDVYENRAPNVFESHGEKSFRPPTASEIKDQIKVDRDNRKFALKNSLPFVCSAFDPHFKLTSGLTLVLGKSGNGKSTLSANIVARIIEENALKDRKILVITNEETTEDIYSRVACLIKGVDWKKYRRDEAPDMARYEIRKVIEGLVREMVVIPAQRENWDMTTVEDVKAVLEYVRQNQKNYGIVLIDYLQTISSSRSAAQKASYEISKELGFFLKQFAQTCVTPVLLFAQIKDSRDASDIAGQIQNDRTIYNHAQAVIEIKPDFEGSQTTFVLHKQRFGDQQGLRIDCQWSGGRFEPILLDVQGNGR